MRRAFNLSWIGLGLLALGAQQPPGCGGSTPPTTFCDGLDEKTCLATAGCQPVYQNDCPPCTQSSPPCMIPCSRSYDHCQAVPPPPPPPPACQTDADCPLALPYTPLGCNAAYICVNGQCVPCKGDPCSGLDES